MTDGFFRNIPAPSIVQLNMPYRADLAALEARVATMERELDAADAAARDGARLRAELTALRAQLDVLRRHRSSP